MDLVDLNKSILRDDPPVMCRDPCGSRGSKLQLSEMNTFVMIVEILVDLVDLNKVCIRELTTVNKSRSLWISWI